MEGGVLLNYPLNTIMSTAAHTIPGPCNTSRMTNSGVGPGSIYSQMDHTVDGWTDTVIRILRQEGCVEKTEGMTK